MKGSKRDGLKGRKQQLLKGKKRQALKGSKRQAVKGNTRQAVKGNKRLALEKATKGRHKKAVIASERHTLVWREARAAFRRVTYSRSWLEMYDDGGTNSPTILPLLDSCSLWRSTCRQIA